MQTTDIWTQIVIPLVIGPLFLVIKEIYDRWNYNKKETLIFKNSIKLEKVNNQLKQFYWPLYILLLKDFDLWSKIKFDDNDTHITYTDSESGLEQDEGYYYCNYINVKDNKPFPCKNPVALNCVDRYGPYCIKHQCYKHKKMLKVYNILFDETNIESKKNDVIDYKDIELGIVENNNKKFQNLVHKKIKYENSKLDINSCSSTSSSSSDIPGNMTGNKIGEIDGININNQKISNDIDIDSNMIENIITLIKENHQKISNIIIDNISIAEPKKNMGKQLMRYIKFINIIMSEHGELINPSKYGAPYPKKLLPMIEIELFKLQKKYNLIVDEYYK